MDEYRLRDLIAKFSGRGDRSEITAALQRQLDRTLAEKQQNLVDNYGYMPEYGDMRSQYSPDMMNAPRGMMNWRDYQAEQERLAEAERQRRTAEQSVHVNNNNYWDPTNQWDYNVVRGGLQNFDPEYEPDFREGGYIYGQETQEEPAKETVVKPNRKQEEPTSYALVDWAHRFNGPASFFGDATAYASGTGYNSTANDAIIDRVPGRAFVDNSGDLDGARTWAAGVTDAVNKNQAERNAALQAQIKARQEAQSQAAAKAQAVRDARRKALGY